jgi:23S rRNA pseudouridine1911/1915/1917 synthase
MEEQELRVMRTVEPAHVNKRLDLFASSVFDGMSRNAARDAIANGEIWVNGKQVRIQSREVLRHDRVTWLCLPPLSDEEADIVEQTGVDWRVVGGKPVYLFRDSHMAILDKQPDVPVESTPRDDLRTCIRQVEATLREEGLMDKRIYVSAAHRLDAGASGALAFGLRKRAAGMLAEQFANHSAERIYRALVIGVIKRDTMTIKHPIGHTGPGVRRGVLKGKRGKRSVTHVEVIERFEDATLIEVKLETGRTHQIRVHMAHEGHPLVGDWLYCPKSEGRRVPRAPRMMLHARQLSLVHPQTEEPMSWEAPLEPSFAAYLDALRKEPG